MAMLECQSAGLGNSDGDLSHVSESNESKTQDGLLPAVRVRNAETMQHCRCLARVDRVKSKNFAPESIDHTTQSLPDHAFNEKV